MSRTKNTHARNAHLTWAKRHGNKTARAWTRQHVREVELSASDAALDEVVADWLEERGALGEAMKLRNRDEPSFPGRPKDRW